MPGQRFLYIKNLQARQSLANGLGVNSSLGFGQQLLLAGLGTLCTVLGTGLHTTVDTLSIQSTTDNVVTNTGKVLYTAAADQNHGVLLQVVADTGDVSGNFHTVGQANTGDLTQCGVRLLGVFSCNILLLAAVIYCRCLLLKDQ